MSCVAMFGMAVSMYVGMCVCGGGMLFTSFLLSVSHRIVNIHTTSQLSGHTHVCTYVPTTVRSQITSLMGSLGSDVSQGRLLPLCEANKKVGGSSFVKNVYNSENDKYYN